MTTRFDQLNLISADMEATLEFYRRLGVRLGDPTRTSAGDPFHANSQGDGALLEVDSPAFARAWNAGWRGEADLNGRVLVGLRVESRGEVDRLYEEITATGHRGLHPPEDAFWGARFAIIEDPNGIAVGLISPRNGPQRPPPPEFS